MRLDNLTVEFCLQIPFDRPDKNGVVYSKTAVEKAIESFHNKLPIVYRDNDAYKDSKILGNTTGSYSAVWNDELKMCEVTIKGNVYFGGTECIVNKIQDNVVTDFSIVSMGISN